MPIYTKKGDRGQTGLFDGTRVAKNDGRIEAIGSIDELNTVIGVVVAEIREKDKNNERLIESLEQIQKDLFGIGAQLAGYETKGLGVRGEGLEEQVREMEEEIDRMWKEMPELSNFILPGGSLAGAQLHLARAVCRRVERTLVREQESRKGGEYGEILKYMNRLGDYLFCLARWVNFLTKSKETVWKAS